MLLSMNLEAQSPTYQFENISQQLQALHFSINDIFQDRHGFLWIGTNNGLFKYDGKNIKSYLHNAQDSTSLSSTRIHTIVEDDNGDLWIGAPYGLNRFDRTTEKFKRYLPYEDLISRKGLNNIPCLLLDSKGQIWTSNNRDLFKFDRITGSFQLLPPADTSKIKPVIRTIVEGNNGEIWCGTSRGLLKVNAQTLSVKAIEPELIHENSYFNVTSIVSNENGHFWLGTSQGLASYDEKNNRIVKFEPLEQWNNKSISEIIMTQEELWLAFDNDGVGIYNLNSGNFRHFTYDSKDNYSLQDNRVSSILQDNFDNIWIGTSTGLSKLSDVNSGFTFIQNVNGIRRSANNILQLHVDNNNNIWTITPDGLYKHKNPHSFGDQFFTPPAKSNNFGNWIYEDPKGFLWVPVTGKGLYNKDQSTSNFALRSSDPGLKEPLVYKIIGDEEDPSILWIGTTDGLCELDVTSGSCIWHQPQGKIEGMTTNRFIIYEQLGDDIYLYYTYFNSLGRFNKSNGEFELIRPPEDQQYMLEGVVRDIAITKDSNVWISTEYGLTQYDIEEDSFHMYTKSDGLAENTTFTLVVDNNHDIWIASTQQVSKFDRRNDQFINYDVSSKVNFFNSKSRALDQTGKIHLGASNGILSFHPDSISSVLESPKIVLTDLMIKSESYPSAVPKEDLRSVVLNHDENDIAFEFVGIQLNRPEYVRYRYKLQGYDEEWHYLNRQAIANYTNLNPGSYTFLAQASNENENWSEEYLQIDLSIIPAFTQSRLFKALVILILIIAAYILIRIWAYYNRLKKQKEIAEKTSEYRMHFLSHASHEIRTPMNAIIGLSGLIQETELNQKQNKYISAIEKASNNLLELINELLDHSKIESGKYSFKRSPFSLMLIIEQLEAMFQPLADEKNLKLSFYVAEDIPDLLNGDSLRLTQILTNLIGNALKFTKTGSINVRIYAGETSDEKMLIHFEVKDTGRGIPSEKMNEVFERFGVDAKGIETKSSGLGLFITKGLVEGQGGTIDLKSKVNEGTIVKCSIPFELAHEINKEPTIREAKITLTDLRILIVDDAPFNHLIASERLKNQIPNVEILTAYDGYEAISIVEKENVDMILMDAKMPGMDGLEATRRIRSMTNGQSDIPILGATASAMQEQIDQCIASGMNDVVTKPINWNALIEKIAYLVQNQNV